MTTTDCCHVPESICPHCHTKFCNDCDRLIARADGSVYAEDVFTERTHPERNRFTESWKDHVCSQQHPEHENVRCIAAKEHYHNHVGFPELGIMAPSNLYLWHNKGDRPITGSPRLDAEVQEALADRARRVATTSGRERGQLDPLRTLDYSMKWQPHTRQWLALVGDGNTIARGDGTTQEEALLSLLANLMKG